MDHQTNRAFVASRLNQLAVNMALTRISSQYGIVLSRETVETALNQSTTTLLGTFVTQVAQLASNRAQAVPRLQRDFDLHLVDQLKTCGLLTR